MSDHHFWLSDAQFARLQPLLPNKPRGVPRVDDRRVISGIVHVIRNGLMWRDAPAAYGPHKTLVQPLRALESGGRVRPDLRRPCRRQRCDRHRDDRRDPSQGASHRSEPAQKGAVPRRIGRTKGGLNSKLHAVCDGDGKPLILLLTEGQVSDYRGAATVLPALPDAEVLIADRGYDSDWFRDALSELEIEPCIPGRSNRKAPIPYNADLYKQRNRIERMFGRLKDWRRIATRYDRCAHTFMSAICIAATVIFWL